MFDELLNSRRIHKESVSQKEVEAALERAERDLRAAKATLSVDPDWCLAMAHNAVLQASRGYMFSRGYRPASGEGHKNTLAFMKVALGKEHEELVGYFDRVRRKRNQAMYDVAGLVTETEASNLLQKAGEFVALIQGMLEAG